MHLICCIVLKFNARRGPIFPATLQPEVILELVFHNVSGSSWTSLQIMCELDLRKITVYSICDYQMNNFLQDIPRSVLRHFHLTCLLLSRLSFLFCRHSPLTVPHSTVYSSVSHLGSQNMNNSETLRLSTALPTFLSSGLPLSTLQPQFKTPMSSVSNSLTVSLNPYSTPHSSLTLGTDGTNSLSGSSSLSSSLVSLHSTPPTGTPLAHKSSQLNSLTSTPRCSLWLKLQVCPSWHPPSTGGLTPTSINTTDVAASSATVTIQNKESKTSSDDSLGECPLPPNTCPYAHPTPNILVENGFVTVCYDFIKVS